MQPASDSEPDRKIDDAEAIDQPEENGENENPPAAIHKQSEKYQEFE